MAVTWKIPNMERDLTSGEHKDIVTMIHWIATDTDDKNNIGTCIGTESVVLKGTPTPYADITEAMAIGWVKDVLGSDEVTRIENNIAAQIAEQPTPTKGTGVSW